MATKKKFQPSTAAAKRYAVRAQKRKKTKLTDAQRLDRIAEIIETVDNRCLHADGPVTPTLQEMEQAEISEIYALAKRRK